MKKKNFALALVLTLVLCLGSISSVFADSTYQDFSDDTIQSIKECQEGHYGVVNTQEVVDAQDKALLVDTMPGYSWYGGYIPGSLIAVCGIENKDGVGDNSVVDFLDAAQKTQFLNDVKTALVQKGYSTAQYTYGSWKTTHKSSVYKKYKKISKNCVKVVKKGTYKYRVRKANAKYYKNANVIVYCGHSKCKRSHNGAMALVKDGYTNVYRYYGGIKAWKDAGYQLDAATL